MSRLTAEETLAAWNAREAELRARMHGPGVSRPDQFAGRTGVQVFEAMFSGELPTAPIACPLSRSTWLARRARAMACWQG